MRNSSAPILCGCLQMKSSTTILPIPTAVQVDDLHAHHRRTQPEKDSTIIVQATPEGLVPVGNMSPEELERLIAAYREQCAATYWPYFLWMNHPIFYEERDAEGKREYQLAPWFAGHFEGISNQDIEGFWEWLPQRHQALANAVQLGGWNRQGGAENFIISFTLHKEQNASPNNRDFSQPLLSIISPSMAAHGILPPYPSFQSIRTQRQAIIATEILWALQEWQCEHEALAQEEEAPVGLEVTFC